MGHRLSKIYTRTGDQGSTGLGDGRRVAKDDARVEALGEVDELNSALGLLLTEALPAAVRECLVSVQHTLFDLGGELSIPGHRQLTADDTRRLEAALDALNQHLPPLKEFILPGGSRGAALCHLARTICRRAERRAFTLARAETVNAAALTYLNRLSDLLFVIARVLARQDGGSEVLWQPGRGQST